MHGNEREPSHQDLWTSQEDEPMQITNDQVRNRARRYESENVLFYWVMLGLTPLFVATFIYNFVRFHQPWLVAGNAWALVATCYVVWRLVRNGPNRIVPGEPCVQFLRREFEGKRQSSLSVRRFIVLLIPALLASWWGGGPLRGKALGIRPSWWPSPLKEHEPLIVAALIVVLVWCALWKEGRKAEREIERLSKE